MNTSIMLLNYNVWGNSNRPDSHMYESSEFYTFLTFPTTNELPAHDNISNLVSRAQRLVLLLFVRAAGDGQSRAGPARCGAGQGGAVSQAERGGARQSGLYLLTGFTRHQLTTHRG